MTSDAYFVQLVTYIHQNPQKHGFVDDFSLWPYSSYRTLLSDKATRLKRDDVLSWFDGRGVFQAFHGRELSERRIAPLVADDW